MPDVLQQHLTEQAAEDRQRMTSAAEAARAAYKYREQAAQGSPVSEEAIREANAMRIVELGEAYKNLIREGTITKDTVVFESDGHPVTAGDIVKTRDRYAHPEGRGNNPADFSDFYAQRDVIAGQLQALEAKSPGNTNVSAALDAVQHLSGGDHVSPTAWKDAENYKQVEVGGQLNEVSTTGKKVIKDTAPDLYTERYDRRNELSHHYQRGSQAEDKPGNAVAQSIENTQSHMVPEKYHAALTGQRPEPELADILGEWSKPGTNRTLDAYSTRNRKLVVEEISGLAKKGASLQEIQDLNDVLHAYKMSPADTQKFMAVRFPDGLSENTRESLGRLNEVALQANPAGQGKGAATFSDVTRKVDAAHQYLTETPETGAVHRLNAAVYAQDEGIRSASVFIKNDVANHGYDAAQIDKVQQEIGEGLKGLSRPGGLQAEELAKLSPETRTVLSDIAEGIKTGDKTLGRLSPEVRANIVANAGQLATAETPENKAAKERESGGKPSENPTGRPPEEIHAPLPAYDTLPVLPGKGELKVKGGGPLESAKTTMEHASNVEGTAVSAASGYLTYSGIREIKEGYDKSTSGHAAAGAGEMVLGSANATLGGAGVVETVAPGTLARVLPEVACEALEHAGPWAMIAGAGYQIATAPKGEESDTAYRVTATTATSGAAMVALGAAGASPLAVILLPIGVGVATDLLVQRDITIDHMRENHETAMKGIAADGHNAHLRDKADQIQNTLQLASFGDGLAKGSDNRIDINNDRNLHAIETHLPADFTKKYLDGKSDGEKRLVLQGQAAGIELAMESREQYIPKDLNLAMKDGKVDLGDRKNLIVLDEVIKKEQDFLAKQAISDDRMASYPHTDGIRVLAKHNDEEERGKTDGIARAELHNIQFGTAPGATVNRTPQQFDLDIAAIEAKARAMAQANGGKQDIETGYVYNADIRHDRIYDMKPSDVSAGQMPEAIAKQYLEQYKKDPKHNTHQTIKQVIYEKDVNGNDVPEKMVIWDIRDADMLEKAQKAAQGSKNSVTYDGGDHVVQTASVASAPGKGQAQASQGRMG